MSLGQFVEEIRRQLRAEIALRHATDRLGADAEEALARLFGAELEAVAAQHRARALQRDRLAVDDHAVAIEDDHLRPDRDALRSRPRFAHRSRARVRSASCSASKTRRLAACKAAISPPAGSLTPPSFDIVVIASAERPPPRGDRAEHRRAEQHRLAGLRRGDAPSGRVGDDLPDQGAARRAAAGDERVAGEAAALEQADDLSQSLRQAAQAGDIERHRALFVVAQDRSRRPRRAPPDRRGASGCRENRARRADRGRAAPHAKRRRRARRSRAPRRRRRSAARRRRRRPGSSASGDRSPRRRPTGRLRPAIGRASAPNNAGPTRRG